MKVRQGGPACVTPRANISTNEAVVGDTRNTTSTHHPANPTGTVDVPLAVLDNNQVQEQDVSFDPVESDVYLPFLEGQDLWDTGALGFYSSTFMPPISQLETFPPAPSGLYC